MIQYESLGNDYRTSISVCFFVFVLKPVLVLGFDQVRILYSVLSCYPQLLNNLQNLKKIHSQQLLTSVSCQKDIGRMPMEL